MEFPRRRTILADTLRGFRYKTSVPNTDKLSEFTAWGAKPITVDEKEQAQISFDAPGRGILSGAA